MSREVDLENLRKLEAELIAAYESADECAEYSSRIKALENEKANPKAVTYNKLPTNNFEALDKQYRDEWVAKHNSIRLCKILASMILGFVLIGITLALIGDTFLGTGYVCQPVVFRDFAYTNSFELLFVIVLVHIILSVIIYNIPKWIFRKER